MIVVQIVARVRGQSRRYCVASFGLGGSLRIFTKTLGWRSCSPPRAHLRKSLTLEDD